VSRNDDHDEAECEMERARASDRDRGGYVRPTFGAPAGSFSVCAECGTRPERLRLDPLNGGRMVCVGRFDETGVDVSCYERLDHELARRNRRWVDEYAATVQAIKQRGYLTAADVTFLRKAWGNDEAIIAFEERFAKSSKRGKGVPPPGER